MRKWNFKKTAAAAIGILVMAGGVSVYAATQNFSLLSLFSSQSGEIKDEAARLLDQNVTQDQRSDEEQSKWVSFEIREAILDRNKVLVQLAAKPADPDKYLLIPDDSTEQEPVSDLGMDGLTGDQRIGEYAKSKGKQCVKVGASVVGDGLDQTEREYTEPDGTFVLVIEFYNEEKTKNPEYVCHTTVVPLEESTSPKGEITCYSGEINFTLTDKSDGEVVKYVPVSDGTVKGTKFVVDAVTFEKSNLEMMCKVEFHYPGEIEDAYMYDDISFLMLDSDGNIDQSSYDGIDGTTWGEKDGITKFMQYGECDLQDLPETITFRAEGTFDDKDFSGTVAVKRAE